MAAHTEELRVHIHAELAEADIKKKFRRIFDCKVTDDKMHIVQRNKDIKIRLSFFMNIIRIKILRIKASHRHSFPVPKLIKDIHIRTVPSDPFRILLVIQLEKYRFGAQAVIRADSRQIRVILHSFFDEILFTGSHRQRDLHPAEEDIHHILFQRGIVGIPNGIKAVLFRLFRCRTSAAFGGNKMRFTFFRKYLLRISDLILQFFICQFAKCLQSSGYCRQNREHLLSDLGHIKTGQKDILRNAVSFFSQSGINAEGHVIIAAYDRIRKFFSGIEIFLHLKICGIKSVITLEFRK